MLLAIKTLFKYVPFAVAGFALIIALISSWLFSAILSGVKLALPMEAWIIPALSILKAILPPLTSLIAAATSLVTVPVLGLGIRFLGPRILPSFPILGITEGVATMTSMS